MPFRLSVGSKCEPIVSLRYRYVGGRSVIGATAAAAIAAIAPTTVVTAPLLLFLMH